MNLLQHCICRLCSGFSALRQLSSLTRDQNRIPYIRRWSLNHWTTGEAPCFLILKLTFSLRSFLGLFEVPSLPPLGLPRWLRGKESTYDAGDTGSIFGSGRSPGGGHGNSPQYSCLENPMDRVAWWATVHEVAEIQTRLTRLSTAQHVQNVLDGYLDSF